jgi:aspartyl-tRNA(Asn)/glutamyl-tRNA(Gln) amidotransferase subunit A
MSTRARTLMVRSHPAADRTAGAIIDHMTSRRSFILGACGAVALSANDDPAALTLAEASERVRKKAISPVDLAKACLQRIDQLNPRLNAYITVTAETALARARDLEAEIQRGRWRGPLHGIPIALKDNIDTAGVRTTAASELFKDRVPFEDAEVVRRLNIAGAIILGKTNLHEFAYGGTSSISYFGAVHNPWALDRIPGGSSGGSAAATAAHLCFGALGTDTASSVRGPACYCGIVGLKPTYGRVSNRGVVPLSWTLDHVGPLCRTVEDAALMLGAIAGYDQMDPTSADAPVPDYSRAVGMQVSKLRLGIPRHPFFDNLDSEIGKAVDAGIAVLRKLTASTQDIELPTTAIPFDRIFNDVRGIEAYTIHSQWLAESPEKYHAITRQRILQNSAEVKASDYAQSRRQLEVLRREIRKSFAAVDLLITPTMPLLQAKISDNVDATRNSKYPLGIRNTAPFDVLGVPAISIPCGFATAGLPIGLQIAGAPFAESTVLALAHAYERATEWHSRSPAL